ncbi:DUF6231 family protein [Marinimicrobium alkaliphilum]|uniref:DUF6231 family protein n=1 Tax=Marinimicrobium alkaliphilum TaxID=2202654 RepID=UPI000DBA9405|nr:DUF6231 family protein [Marinimicrobium alkaliphilum]
MTPAQTALAQVIDACEPQSLVALGTLARQMAGRWAEGHSPCHLTALDAAELPSGWRPPAVQDLALVTDTLEHRDKSEARQLLGQLRNYGTRQIAVLVTDSTPWTLSDFIGLGFRRQAQLDTDPPLSLYTYNIDTYNHKRPWNNARFWANPERWGKHWW